MINYDDYVVSYNKQAMIALKNNQINVAFNLLTQAESILKRKQVVNVKKLLGLTYNNLGCFYKRSGDYPQALKFFKKSLNEESQDSNDNIRQASTHLNVCTVYSLLIDHAKALSHAMCALELLKLCSEESENFVFTIVNAYHNAAIEYESLSQYKPALNFYKKAYNYSLSKLGQQHNLTLKIQERLVILKNKIVMCSFDSDLSIIKKQEKTKPQVSFTPKPKLKKRANHSLTPVISNGVRIVRPAYKRKKLSRDKDLESLVKNKKKIIFEAMNRLNQSYDRAKSVMSKRIKTSTNLKKSGGIKYLRFDDDKTHLRSQSKSPDVLPVPFRSKLTLFESSERFTP